MYFAEFYTKGVRSGKLIPACGDRAVLILDGRESRDKQIQAAMQWGKQHHFDAFQICRGPSFASGSAISPMLHTASY